MSRSRFSPVFAKVTMRHFRQLTFTSLLRKRTVLSGLIAVAVCAAGEQVRATDYTWANAGTDFNLAASWGGAGFPNATADNAIFATAQTQAPNLSSNVSINELNFSTAASTGYTLSATGGAALTLNSILATSTQSAISSIQATGTTNTISAPIILGAAANSTQTFFNNVASANLVVSGQISEATGPVNLQILGLGTTELSGNNSYTGNTTIGSGTGLTLAKISNANALGTAASTVTIAAASRLQLSGGIVVPAAKSLVINNSTSVGLTSAGNNTWSGNIDAAVLTSRLESTSGTLTVLGNITTVAGANSLVFQDTGAINVSGIISGPGSVTRSSTGTGVATLSGANTYTGVTSVSNGTISVSSLNSVSSPAASSGLGRPTTSANGTINLGSTGATGILKYTGGGETTDRIINMSTSTSSSTIDQSGGGLLKFTSNFSASTQGAKTLTLIGAGNGEIAGAIPNVAGAATNSVVSVSKTGTGTWTLSGANSYSGTATVAIGGTLRVSNSGGLGFGSVSALSATSAGSTVATGGTLDLAGVTMQEVITLNGTGVGGNGALINSSASPTTIGGGLASLNLTAAGTYSTAPTVTVDSGTATATTSLGLSNASISVTAGGTGYAATSVVTITGGGGTGATGTVILSGSTITGINITNPGTGYTSAPTVTVTNGGSGATFSNNATNFVVSNVRLSNAGSGYTTAPTISFSNGAATATANLTSVVLGSNSSIGGTGDITINSVVSGGSFTLTKVGSNTLSLNGVNTYTGVTTVSGGRLQGIGTLSGNLANSAVVAPGNSIGTLTVLGDATFNAGSTYEAELGAANSSDLLNLTSPGSNLSLATATDTLNLLSTLDPGTFTIVDYLGTRTGIFDNVTFNSAPQTSPTITLGTTNPAGFTGTGDLYVYSNVSVFYNATNTSVQVAVTAIPEPSTLALGGIALLGFAGVGLRKRRLAKVAV